MEDESGYFNFLIVAPSGIFTSNWLAGSVDILLYRFNNSAQAGFPPAGA